jgi:hypothetical protein
VLERAEVGDPRHNAVSKVIEDNGGPDFVRKLHAQVTEYSAGRQPYAVIDCERLTVEQTCQAVELREELGITASEPSSPPMHEIRTATFDMQIWLIDRWTGTSVNAAPDEHDAVAWFDTSDLDSLCLARESYLSMLTAVLVT